MRGYPAYHKEQEFLPYPNLQGRSLWFFVVCLFLTTPLEQWFSTISDFIPQVDFGGV